MDILREAGKILLKLVETYTPSGEEPRLHPYLEELAGRLGFEEAYPDEAGNFHMSYGKGETILLAGHLDTIPGRLPAKLENNQVHGRGAVDAKGPLAAFLIGAALAREELGNMRVSVAALVREETDGFGAKYLVENGYMAKHVIVGEPTGMGIAVAYRGSLTFEARAKARGGHSSAPYMGESALNKLLEFIKDVGERFDGKSYGEPTHAVTMLRAGEWSGSLPENAHSVVNIRFPRPYSSGEIISQIREAADRHGVEYRVIDSTEPVEVGVKTPVVRALMRAMLKMGVKPKLVRKTGTSDMNTLYRLTPSITAFGPGDSRLAHTRMEKLDINDLITAARIISQTILELSTKKQA